MLHAKVFCDLQELFKFITMCVTWHVTNAGIYYNKINNNKYKHLINQIVNILKM